MPKNHKCIPKKALFLMLLVLCMPLLASCWNYKDIENMTIATGLAIDKDAANNEYIVTIELVNQGSGGGSGSSSGASGGEGAMSSSLVITRGFTIFDAMRNAITQTGKRIFWGHTKAIIISEEIAREGILPIVDIIWRDTETRPDMWLLIAKTERAAEIFETANELNEITSYHLNDVLKADKSLPKYIVEEFVDFLGKLSIRTNSVATPAVNVETIDGKKLAIIEGSAVFKQDKLLYFLNGEESQLALLVKDKLQGGVFNIEEKRFGEKTRITLEIFSSKVKLKPSLENGQLMMKIDARIDVGISELESSVNFIDKEKRALLKKDMERILVRKTEEIVKKMQKQNACDIFDFGGTIQRKMPNYWKTIEPKWDEVFKNMPVSAQVNMKIRLSSSTQKPIKIGE